MKIKSSLSTIALLCVLVFTGCKDENVEEAVILQSTEYQIYDVSGSGVTGTATFTQEDNGSTHVLIELDGADTSTNPAYIRYNSAAEGGGIAITLEACECAISNTTITALNNGTSITYEGLIAFYGHITIEDLSGNIVAVADIGANAE